MIAQNSSTSVMEVTHLTPTPTSVAEVSAVNLRFLKKEDLILKLRHLVKSERKIAAEILEYIKEIDRRRIYLDLGHTSLFSYLTKDLGYTPAAAQRRIDSARMLNEIPELKAELKSGNLNLTQISMLAQCIRQRQKEIKSSPASNDEKREPNKKTNLHDLKSL